MRKLIAAALLATLSASASAGTVYYLDFVNNAPSSIVAFDVAPAGAAHFRPALTGAQTLPGGGVASTVAIRGANDGCLRDLRIAFADGHVVNKRVDVCALRR